MEANLLARNEERFGACLAQIRKTHHVTMRALAEHLGFSAAYLSDVEHGHRYPFNLDALRKISDFLSLTQEEEYQLYDAAALSRDTVAPDIAEYIKERKPAAKAVRIACALDISDDAWLRFIQQIQREHPSSGTEGK